MARRGVPFHRCSVARIKISFARGDQAKFEGRSCRDEFAYRISSQVLFGLLVAMRSTCDRHKCSVYRRAAYADGTCLGKIRGTAWQGVNLEGATQQLAEKEAF